MPHPLPGASDPDLAFALELADTADALTLGRFRAADLAVASKPDASPVSDADRAVEEMVRDRVATLRPGDTVHGEELGAAEPGRGGRRWIVDPIDGTRNYVRGVPVFATLLALERDGELEVGVVSAPALGHRWWAARDAGAFLDGARVRVSAVERLDGALLSYDGVRHFDEAGLTDRFLALARRCARTRAFGDFWSHVLVADGSVDAAIEGPGLQLHDLAPLLVIVEEAGGRFTDLAGHRTAAGGSACATNGRLHDEVLAALGPLPGG